MGFRNLVTAMVGDRAHPGQPLGGYDLIWSECTLHNIGLENALHLCHGLLRPSGYLAFTDSHLNCIVLVLEPLLQENRLCNSGND